MISQNELLEILEKKYSTDNKGDYFQVTNSLTFGVVVDTDDPLQMGRLRVFCPSFGDDPSKIHSLPWTVYVPPYGGTINNSDFERNGETSEGSVSYGFWAIPELGASVVVGCIDNDLRRRCWFGSVYDQQETHTLLNGRYKWDGGNVEGPLSSSGSPIEPAYSNGKESFSNKTSSPEFQSRHADYSVASVSKAPTPDKNSYIDQQEDEISKNQNFDFNKDIVGNNGYDWSGFMNSHKSSRVFGFSTPGFHGFSMDDRPFNSRVKIKTTTGHMILLDDTNERIYIKTNKGKSWMEMDSAGNIDAYAERRASIHSELDLNLTSNKTVRIKGKEGVYIYGGDENGLPDIPGPITPGQVRIQSQDDMHIVSKNYRMLSFEDSYYEIGKNKFETVGVSSFTQVQNDINTITNDGDYNLTVSGNFNLDVVESINMFAIENSNLSSRGNTELYSYFGKLNLGSQQDVTVKTVSGDVNIQAVGGNSGGNGAVKIKSPESQMSVSKSGTSITTSGDMNIQSGGDTNFRSNAPTLQTPPPIPAASLPALPNIDLGSSVPLNVDGLSNSDIAARAAWNAGFRDESLLTIVAIIGAESKFNSNAIGDTSLQTVKWGPSCGFCQIRSLVDPTQFHFPDSLRVKDQLFDPQYNLNAAFAFSNSGKNFGPWSTYMAGDYLKPENINEATAAIQRLADSGDQPQAAFNNNTLSIDSINSISIDETILQGSCLGLSSFKLGMDGISMQSLQDIGMHSVSKVMSTPVFSGIVDKVDEISLQLNTLAYYSSLAMSAIGSIVGSVINFPINAQAILNMIPIPSSFAAVLELLDAGICVDIPDVQANFMPYLTGKSEIALNLENFNLNGGTILL